MSENMELDCRIGYPLAEAEVGVFYDLDEEYMLLDESGKIVMYAHPETFAKFRNNRRVAAAVDKWRRDPKNVFKVAKDITVETVVEDAHRRFKDDLSRITQDIKRIILVKQATVRR